MPWTESINKAINFPGQGEQVRRHPSLWDQGTGVLSKMQLETTISREIHSRERLHSKMHSLIKIEEWAEGVILDCNLGHKTSCSLR